MPGKRVPELTRKAIQKAYRSGGVTYPQLAARFGVSEGTVKRICKDVERNSAVEVVSDAIAHGATVKIGDIDLTEYLQDGIKDMSADIKTAQAKSKEGIASAALKYMQFYAELHPPTLEDFVDRLLDRPDFDPEKFVAILKARYAAKAG